MRPFEPTWEGGRSAQLGHRLGRSRGMPEGGEELSGEDGGRGIVLVTGAAGKTGRVVIRRLAARNQAVRALVRRYEQVAPLEALGVGEVVVGDMREPATMEKAAAGVRAVYHICPNVSPDELAIGRVAIAAACSAGVRHFVFHSVLHPQTEAMPHHWQKLRVEEHLFESGLSYTILQPAVYMQNVLAQWGQVVEHGLYAVPYSVETRLGMVDLEDVAAAAAVVLTEPGYAGGTYELAGPDAPSQVEAAAILAAVLRRPVRAETVSHADWERRVRLAGFGDYQVETLVKMFHYYEQFGFQGNSRVLGWLLGRPPATFAAFAERTAREQRDVSRS